MTRRSKSNDHGNPRLHRPRDRLGQRLRFLRADDQQVHSLADELLDVRALLERVVLSVLESELDAGMLGCLGLDVGVHLDAPRLAEICLGHADCESLARFAAAGLGRRGIGQVISIASADGEAEQ